MYVYTYAQTRRFQSRNQDTYQLSRTTKTKTILYKYDRILPNGALLIYSIKYSIHKPVSGRIKTNRSRIINTNKLSERE